ncbi:MAG: ABC transporter substrate-binding protein [Balneola sp.]|nr:MAG: ABC transporter substrate-binding protein [Balneola sp.]
MRKVITTIFAVFCIGISSMQVIAQENEQGIRTLLTERDDQIKELLGPEGQEYSEEQRENLKEIINGIIDFEAMAKTALADTYNEISAESRTEFIDLFSTIVRDHSMNKLEIYRAVVTYNSIEVEDGSALVKTMAELDEVRTPVDYKMVLEGEEWVITDMSVDDLWTAESYKNQFQRIIARRGFDALMDSLRKRAAQ